MNLLKFTPLFFLLFSLSAEQKILFIGNSYTGGVRKTVTELFKQEKVDAKIEYINPGGKNLKYHVKNEKTLAKINSTAWDKIILQDQSQTPALPGYNKIFHEATAEFSKLFKSLDKKPQVFLYMTWGRRDGDKKNKKLFPDFTAMQKLLTENYQKAAKDNLLMMSPVGLAFKKVHASDKELFKSLYAKDGSHPSKAGAYLAACVFYGTLLKKDPTSIVWTDKLDVKTAKTLKGIAKSVISQ